MGKDRIVGKSSQLAFKLVALVLACAALYWASLYLDRLTYWQVFSLLAVFSLPVFTHLSEGILFRRHAILDKAAMPGSKVRRWFWDGNFVLAMQVGRAFFWAILLLSASTLLSAGQWAVVALDCLALVSLAHICNRQLAGQVRADYLGVFVRSWPLLWLNTVLLAVTFFFLDFFYGAADTRSVAWQVLAEKVQDNVLNASATRWIGLVSGWMAAIDQLVWHAAQVIIPAIEPVTVKVLAWLIVLLPAGVIAYALNHYLLGVLSLSDRFTRQTPRQIASSRTSSILLIMTGVLALGYWGLPKVAFKPVVEQVSQLLNPCEADANKIAALQTSVWQELQQSTTTAKVVAHQRIDQQVDEAFAGIEKRLDDYLDWYFSIKGEYERLAVAVTHKVAGNKTLEDLLNEKMQQTMFDPEPMEKTIHNIPHQVLTDSSRDLQYAASALQGQLIKEVEQAPCALASVQLPVLSALDFSRDRQRAVVSLGAGGLVFSAYTAHQLAYRIGRALAPRITSTSIIARVIAKRGGSIASGVGTATALCSPAGPFAAACGLTAGIATWFAIDKAMIAYDEARYREQMRAEILELLNQQKNGLKAALKKSHDVALMQMMDRMYQNIDRAFIPARDGI